MHHSPEKSATEASTGVLRKVRGAHTEAAVDGSKAMAIVEIVEKSAIRQILGWREITATRGPHPLKKGTCGG
jgi:hypothetical protein